MYDNELYNTVMILMQENLSLSPTDSDGTLHWTRSIKVQSFKKVPGLFDLLDDQMNQAKLTSSCNQPELSEYCRQLQRHNGNS